jgi:hypothetical protein
VAALPKFSRGLSLVRYAVLGTLLQIVLTIVVMVKMRMASTPSDAQTSLDWFKYLLGANGVISLAMFIGAASAIPELRRLRLRAGSLIVSAVCFAIATGVLVWAYHLLAALLDPSVSLEEKMDRMESFKHFDTFAILRSVTYALGLIMLLGCVERASQDIDKIALRDEAGTMRRALIVLLVGEIFYQYTYGLAGGGIGITGLVAALLMSGYWIYCHVRLARFLYNAAGLINEGSAMPMAIVKVEKSEPVARPSEPKPAAARPSAPKVASAPKPIVPVAPIVPIVPTPIVPAPFAGPRPIVPTPVVPAPVVPTPVAAKPVVPTPAAAKPETPAAPAPIVAVDPRPAAATPAVSNTGGPDDGPKFLR